MAAPRMNTLWVARKKQGVPELDMWLNRVSKTGAIDTMGAYDAFVAVPAIEALRGSSGRPPIGTHVLVFCDGLDPEQEIRGEGGAVTGWKLMFCSNFELDSAEVKAAAERAWRIMVEAFVSGELDAEGRIAGIQVGYNAPKQELNLGIMFKASDEPLANAIVVALNERMGGLVKPLTRKLAQYKPGPARA